MKARFILVVDTRGLLIPARAERLAEKLNADLSAEAVADDFGPGAGEART